MNTSVERLRDTYINWPIRSRGADDFSALAGVDFANLVGNNQSVLLLHSRCVPRGSIGDGPQRLRPRLDNDDAGAAAPAAAAQASSDSESDSDSDSAAEAEHDDIGADESQSF